MHIEVVFSNSQKPYGLACDIFPLCNRIKCLLEICENILRSDTRHKSRLSHVNVFYVIMEDN